MKKKVFFYIATALVFLILNACSPSFDARWYRRTVESDDQEDSSDMDIDVDIEPLLEDPFKIAPYNDPKGNGFDASQFDNWAIRLNTDSKGVPTYQFVTPSAWIKTDITDKNEYKQTGPKASLKGYSASMEYYVHRGIHPQFSPNSSYNTGSHGARIGRFYFYRFNGKPPAVTLRNQLVAIDTYTKLIFAYSGPSYLTGLGVPRDWKPFESERRDKFYECDPVGIVNADGSVELYDWFKESTKSFQDTVAAYKPRRNPAFTEVAGPGKPGKSPFRPEKQAQSPVSGTLKVKPMAFENISVKGLDWKKRPVSYAYFVYGFRSRIVKGEEEKPYTMLASVHEGKALGGAANLIALDLPQIFVGKNVSLVDKMLDRKFVKETDSLFFEFDACVAKYDWGFLGFQTRSENFATYDDPIISFRYDRTKEAWVYDTKKGSYASTTGVPVDFELKDGEEKELSIVYSGEAGHTKVTWHVQWLVP